MILPELGGRVQSVFPPDVHAAFDHGRRDVSEFPIARGTYYSCYWCSSNTRRKWNPYMARVMAVANSRGRRNSDQKKSCQ